MKNKKLALKFGLFYCGLIVFIICIWLVNNKISEKNIALKEKEESGLDSNQEITSSTEDELNQIPAVYIAADNLDNWGNDAGDSRVASLEYVNNGESAFTTTIKMNPQANGSVALAKKDFAIHCYTDESLSAKNDVEVNEAWGTQNSYCLTADYVDPTHTCNVVSAKMAGRMDKKYEFFQNAPNYGLTDGFPVMVYLNGVCNGLYNLTIPEDAWMYGMDAQNENNIVMGGKAILNLNGTFVNDASADEWDVKVGPDTASTYDKFNRVVSFIRDSSDEEFMADFSDYLDLDSCLNYYIFSYLTSAEGNFGENLQMVTYDGFVWAPAFYDLDSLWGVRSNGTEQLPATLETENYQCTNNVLFKRLKALYGDELYDRYTQLRQTIFTDELLLNAYQDYYNQIPTAAVAVDKEIWPDTDSYIRTADMYNSFIPERLSYTDKRMELQYADEDQSTILYDLPEVFTGNETDKFVNTGINICSDKYDDYTILMKANNVFGDTNNVFFSCFSENAPYRGVMLRNSTKEDFDYLGGEYETFVKADLTKKTFTTAIKKTGTLYQVYYNGELSEEFNSESDPYDGALYLGCEIDENGELYRFSNAQILKFQVYNGVQPQAVTESILKEWED